MAMSTPAHPAGQPCCPPTLICPPLPSAGSRGRRLWELSARAHCPVIGVCLSLATLRQLADKALGGEVLAEDCELHSGVVQECALRGCATSAPSATAPRRPCRR